MSDETGRRLAELIGHPPRPKTRSMFGTVTQVAPLLVHPEGARAGVVIGPCALVRDAPKVGDQVPMIQLPEQSMWIAIGPLVTGNVVLFYGGRPSGNYDLRYRRWTGAWDAAATVLATDATTPSAARSDAGDIGGLAEPSTVFDFYTSASPLGAARSPHIFRMSDGATVVLMLNPGGGYNPGVWAFIRSATGVWDAGTLVSTDWPDYFDTSVWTRNGDTIYGAASSNPGYIGRSYVYRIVYAAGAITITAVRSGNTTIFFAPYFDTTNGLLHIYGLNVITSFGGITARDPMTLAQVYGAPDEVQPQPQNVGGNATPDNDIVDAAGDGSGSFFLCTGARTGTTPRVFAITASATGYTFTQETGVPATDGTLLEPLSCLWDGTSLHIFAAIAYQRLAACQRTGPNAYSAWTTFTDAGSGWDGHAACAIRAGGVARVVFYRGIGTAPQRRVWEATVAAAP